MKNVLLYGVHSVNLGDDLFFKIIIERYKTTRFILHAPVVYRSIFKNYENCEVVSNSDLTIKHLGNISKILHLPASLLLYLYLFVKYKIDVILIAGGSLFIEGNSNMPKFIRNIKKISLFFPRIKICIIGSNFGPSTTESWKLSVNNALKNVDDVCFRDIQSYKEFSNLKNVRWANDIVMHQNIKCSPIREKVLCVNIRSVENWPTLKPKKTFYLQKTKQIIEGYYTQGYAIKLISFCKKYGDNIITDELYEMLEYKERVECLYYEGNLNECVEVISTADTILATRFHAIILGLIYGLKIIPISYSIKTENMLKTLGVWKEIYDYNAYCNANIEQVLINAIDSFEVDKTNNKQFDFLDSLYRKIQNRI